MLCWTVWMSIFDSENVLPTVSYPPLQCKHSEHTWHGTPSKLTFEDFVHTSSYRKALLRVYIYIYVCTVYIYMYIAYITILLYTIIYEIHIFQICTGHVSEPVRVFFTCGVSGGSCNLPWPWRLHGTPRTKMVGNSSINRRCSIAMILGKLQ